MFILFHFQRGKLIRFQGRKIKGYMNLQRTPCLLAQLAGAYLYQRTPLRIRKELVPRSRLPDLDPFGSLLEKSFNIPRVLYIKAETIIFGIHRLQRKVVTRSVDVDYSVIIKKKSLKCKLLTMDSSSATSEKSLYSR